MSCQLDIGVVAPGRHMCVRVRVSLQISGHEFGVAIWSLDLFFFGGRLHFLNAIWWQAEAEMEGVGLRCWTKGGGEAQRARACQRFFLFYIFF